MKRVAVRVAAIVALVGLGWAAGRAQTSKPEFEIRVDALEGAVKVTCVRGCRLAWTERGVTPNAARLQTFDFGCKGSGGRCSSGTIGGWVDR